MLSLLKNEPLMEEVLSHGLHHVSTVADKYSRLQSAMSLLNAAKTYTQDLLRGIGGFLFIS